MPLYVMRHMNWPGFPGLFVAGIFSGSLRYIREIIFIFNTCKKCFQTIFAPPNSTLAAGVNSLAAVFWKDFIHNFCCSHLDDHYAAIVTRFLGEWAYDFRT